MCHTFLPVGGGGERREWLLRYPWEDLDGTSSKWMNFPRRSHNQAFKNGRGDALSLVWRCPNSTSRRLEEGKTPVPTPIDRNPKATLLKSSRALLQCWGCHLEDEVVVLVLAAGAKSKTDWKWLDWMTRTASTQSGLREELGMDDILLRSWTFQPNPGNLASLQVSMWACVQRKRLDPSRGVS